MAHHTRFVQGRLPIKDKNIPILQMTIHLLVHRSLRNECPGSVSAGTFGNCEKCVCECLSLIPAEFILQKIVGDFDQLE